MKYYHLQHTRSFNKNNIAHRHIVFGRMTVLHTDKQYEAGTKRNRIASWIAVWTSQRDKNANSKPQSIVVVPLYIRFRWKIRWLTNNALCESCEFPIYVSIRCVSMLRQRGRAVSGTRVHKRNEHPSHSNTQITSDHWIKSFWFVFEGIRELPYPPADPFSRVTILFRCESTENAGMLYQISPAFLFCMCEFFTLPYCDAVARAQTIKACGIDTRRRMCVAPARAKKHINFFQWTERTGKRRIRRPIFTRDGMTVEFIHLI